MAWTTPRTWTTGELVTKSIMDTHVRDNLDAVHVTQVTALPGSPFDGQLIMFTNSTTGPAYTWLLRYNVNSASSFKWEFIGGSPFYSTNGDITNNSTTYAVVNSPAAITAPLAGEYWMGIQASGSISNNAAQAVISYLGVRVGAVDPTDEECKSVASYESQGNTRAYGDGGEMKIFRTLAAADSLRLAYRASVTSNTTNVWRAARLFVYPIRVG